MSLSTIASVIQPTPRTNSTELVSGLETLVRSGQQNEANLAQQLSRPLPSDLQPSGSRDPDQPERVVAASGRGVGH